MNKSPLVSVMKEFMGEDVVDDVIIDLYDRCIFGFFYTEVQHDTECQPNTLTLVASDYRNSFMKYKGG